MFYLLIRLPALHQCEYFKHTFVDRTLYEVVYNAGLSSLNVAESDKNDVLPTAVLSPIFYLT